VRRAGAGARARGWRMFLEVSCSGVGCYVQCPILGLNQRCLPLPSPAATCVPVHAVSPVRRGAHRKDSLSNDRKFGIIRERD